MKDREKFRVRKMVIDEGMTLKMPHAAFSCGIIERYSVKTSCRAEISFQRKALWSLEAPCLRKAAVSRADNRLKKQTKQQQPIQTPMDS